MGFFFFKISLFLNLLFPQTGWGILSLKKGGNLFLLILNGEKFSGENLCSAFADWGKNSALGNKKFKIGSFLPCFKKKIPFRMNLKKKNLFLGDSEIGVNRNAEKGKWKKKKEKKKKFFSLFF